MKRIVALLVIAGLLAACQTAQPQPSSSPTISPTVDLCGRFMTVSSIAMGENALPDVSVECLQGEDEVRLSTLRGPLVIAVWASWCEPCSEEMPIMQAFYEKWASRVDVLGYDLLDESTQAIAASNNWGVILASVEDPDGVYRPELSLTAPPTTLFIDQGGHIVGRHLGAVKSLAELESLVEENLGVDLID